MQEQQNWREVLGKILSDPQERQRVANELGVRPITLMRWINNQADPRPQNVRRLLNALPEHRELLLELMGEELQGFVASTTGDDFLEEIPSAFYARILNAHASTPEPLHPWSISTLILQQALKQLDPDRLGLSITIVRCMPPSGTSTKVSSLRESMGQGTPPWKGDLESEAMFLGAESLAGYAVTSNRPAVARNIDEEPGLLPVRRTKYEKSSAAYPILRAGRIAGCLLVSSAQPNYFLSAARLSLIQGYADLMVLAFEPSEFYDPPDVQLRVMPSYDTQKKYFATFRERIAQVMQEAVHNGRPINTLQAEQLVWQQLEEELLREPTILGE